VKCSGVKSDENFYVVGESLFGGDFLAQTKKTGYISVDDFTFWAWAMRTASVPNFVNNDLIFGGGCSPW